MSISEISAITPVVNPTDRQQKYWTVDAVEHWMCFRGRYGPQIDPSDGVSWRCADGDIIDMSVGSYVRDRNKWASRPIDS